MINNYEVLCHLDAEFILPDRQILCARIVFPAHSLGFSGEILEQGLRLEFQRALTDLNCPLNESDYAIDYDRILRLVVGAALEYSRQCFFSNIFGDKLPNPPTVKTTFQGIENGNKNRVPFAFQPNLN